MITLRKVFPIFIGVGLLLIAPSAMGFSGFADDWKSEYPDVCQDLVDAADDCSLCHSAGGFATNDYGEDYLLSGRDPLSIEDDDSDGDGRTNGQEINQDCTLPGDPNDFVANEEATWGLIKKVFESRGIDL